jgi:hypothetical protein
VQDKWLSLINTVTKPVNPLDVSSVTRDCSRETHIDKKSLLEWSSEDEAMVENVIVDRCSIGTSSEEEETAEDD